MASRSDAKCYTHDTWVVDIYENLLIPTNELEDLHAVIISVCRVPKSLRSSARPEAFIPQFVGLGPYHHDRPELIMTDQLKLAAVKRALKQDFHLYSEETLRQRLEIFLSDSDIQAFYHIDVSSKYNYHTLLYLLTVDGLFLLGLLHRAAATAKPAGEDSDSYFLTGKHGMALVNASGVELTMDFIIRDVFMLENQIPTHFLKQIKEAVMSNNKEIQPHVEVYQDLDETMQNFCESLCPFLLSKKPSKKPEAHHLLDLMYQLIVPEPEPESDPEPESEPMPNPELKSEPKPMSKPEPDQSVPLLDQPGPQSEVKDEQAGTKNRNTCCSMCGDILVFLVVACFIMGFIVQHILKLLLWILKSLFRIILWVLRPLYNVLVKWSYIIHPVVEALYNFLSKNDAQISLLKPWTKMVGDIKKTSEEVGRDYLTKGDKDTRQAVTIPSVTELHSAGINFQPAKGGISSIDFDHMNCQFYLPVIKLDANSEVIIRNLVAYESLTKSKGLIFTRYVELMRAIIDTPQDVKLLVLNKIIDTELSDEVVAQLFNGMSKSIRPTKTRKLEQVIKKVNAKFDSTQEQKRAMINYVSTYGKMLTAIAALVFLVLTAVQTYCSVFGCSPSSNFAGILPQVHIPENLPMDAAAPLLCAGITVFSPLKDHDLVHSPGKKIGVVGLGGLGHVAVKFGKAFGHHVTVISTSPSKEAEAKQRLGADDFILSNNPNQLQAARRSLDFILDTVSAEHSLVSILELLKVNGTLFIVGAPDKPFQLPAFPLIFGKRSVKGGIIGGIKETQEMLDVCGKHNITCDIEVVKPDRINEAMQRLAKNDVRYRFVIDIAGSSNN